MPITTIDFEELNSNEESKGMGLQYLVGAIGRGLGYRVQMSGTGADQGRDLFFWTSNEVKRGLPNNSKILVSCKDYSKSGKRLRSGEMDSFALRVKQHGCNGYLLATTTMPTDDLVTMVHDVALEYGFSSEIWQPDDLRDILLNGQDDVFRFTLARFFPVSSRRNDVDEHLVDCFLESLDFMKDEDALSLSLRFVQGLTDPLTIWKCIQKLNIDIGFDFERELQPHIARAVGLNNGELTTAIEESEEFLDALESWALSESAWESFSMLGLSMDNDGDLIVEFESTEIEYTMGTHLDTTNLGTIKWSEHGFEFKTCVNDWEEAKRLDAECDADYEAAMQDESVP